MKSSLVALGLVLLTSCHAAATVKAPWPDTPFTTQGRLIKSASGKTVTYAGVNWPGAADAMLPEGLQYDSIAKIVSKIKSLGMNVIRLTYAIEMIDDIYSGNPNSTLQGTLINALGVTNGTKVLNQILHHNPQFCADTTRLQVFDAVAAECATQQIYVHLDNHVSKAQWCCGEYDGNAWWGDTYFNITNWRRGIAYMAENARSWDALVSMSLRNEPRDPLDNATVAAADYNWIDWYENVVPGANGIHAANPNPLIFFSGQNYDTDLGAVVTGQTPFNISALPYANKVVFEIHNYENSATSCDDMVDNTLYPLGYNAMNRYDESVENHAPVVMTEFGFGNDDSTYQGVYAQCIKQFLTTGLQDGPGGWMVWVLAGSYYIRSGAQDVDETWGLFNHDWSAWRSKAAINNYFKPMVKATLN